MHLENSVEVKLGITTLMSNKEVPPNSILPSTNEYLVEYNMVGHIAIKKEVPLSWEALLTCKIYTYISLKARRTEVPLSWETLLTLKHLY